MPVGYRTADRRVRPAAGIGARLAAACAALALYVLWVRPQLLTWGATREEITRGYPGDELIPEADRAEFTMATTLPAPPEKVWLWLVQIGGDRAGFYSWDRLDHHGEPSADRIMQTCQFRNLRARVSARGRGLS